mgnify:FL=1
MSHYTTDVAPNYRTMFFDEGVNHTHQYMLETIPLSAIRTIAFLQLSSHSLWCATRHQSKSDESNRLCTLCPKQVREFEYHTLIQFSAFDQSQCALLIATFIGKVLEH